MPLTQQVLQLDPDFKDRAAELIKDARKRSRRTKPTHGLKQWCNDADVKTFAAETTVKTGAAVGVFFAGAAIAAAGVAAGAVTFGIGPAIGVVVGLGVAKGLTEFHYQRASKKLRKGIAQSGKDDYGGDTFPIELLSQAYTKVLKKYLRVARRGKMLKGGHSGRAHMVRNPVTALKAQVKKPQIGGESRWVKRPEENLSNQYQDRELARRLLELRYYGQMAFNAVSDLADRFVGHRNDVLDLMALLHAHILRQVHFTGHHESCHLTCYTIPSSEFRHNVNALVQQNALQKPKRPTLMPKPIHDRRFAKKQNKAHRDTEFVDAAVTQDFNVTADGATNADPNNLHLAAEQFAASRVPGDSGSIGRVAKREGGSATGDFAGKHGRERRYRRFLWCRGCLGHSGIG